MALQNIQFDHHISISQTNEYVEFIKSHTPMILPQDIPHEVRAAKCLHFPDQQNKGTLDYQTLLDTLKESGWIQSKAARKLGVNRITIWRNIKKYHIAIPAE